MASEEKPDESAADDGMADWAEALLEQKATDPGANDGQGGVLAGEAPKPFSSMPSGGGDVPSHDINMVLFKKKERGEKGVICRGESST